jgi:tellurite resistance protein
MNGTQERMMLKTPADACAALAVLVAGADGIGTAEEGQHLYETLATLSVFDGLDRAGMSQLMANATEWVWSNFPTRESRLTEEGASELLGRICEALPGDLAAEAFRAAVELARSDGMSFEERELLGQLQASLEIDPESAREVLGPDA